LLGNQQERKKQASKQTNKQTDRYKKMSNVTSDNKRFPSLLAEALDMPALDHNQRHNDGSEYDGDDYDYDYNYNYNNRVPRGTLVGRWPRGQLRRVGWQAPSIVFAITIANVFVFVFFGHCGPRPGGPPARAQFGHGPSPNARPTGLCERQRARLYPERDLWCLGPLPGGSIRVSNVRAGGRRGTGRSKHRVHGQRHQSRGSEGTDPEPHG